MVAATLDDGQELLGLNEVYIGHPTHQSSRYHLSTSDGQARAAVLSGVVVGTGTGATGWCASIARQRADAPDLPGPGGAGAVLVRPGGLAVAGHRGGAHLRPPGRGRAAGGDLRG